MDFFERQDQARRNTKLLVVYFVLGVAMLIVAVYAAVLVVFAGAGLRHDAGFGPGSTTGAVESDSFSLAPPSARSLSLAWAAPSRPWNWPRAAARSPRCWVGGL